MTLKELLKSNGIADDMIEKIESGMKENKIYTASEENLDVRYGKLKTDHEAKVGELTKANELIEQLKKSAKGDEELQGKIKNYESEVEQLKSELQKTKLNSAIKVALLAEKAKDVDYLAFKLESKLAEEGKKLELDDAEKIKGWDSLVDGLKTQFPTLFENSKNKSKVLENKLEEGDNNETLTKDKILKMPYAERAKLFDENPDGYHAAMEKE